MSNLNRIVTINIFIYYFIRILIKLDLLKFFNFKVTARIENKRILLPFLGNTGYINVYDHEPWMQQVLSQLLTKDSTFLDIGMNLGQTLIKVKSRYPEVKYYGFEPNPNCFSYLYNLININFFLDVKIFPVGISDKKQILELRLPVDQSLCSAEASYIKYIDEKSIITMLSPPDELLESIGVKIDVIKIDVEGWECNVLYSLEGIVKSFHPDIIVEIFPAYDESNNSRIDNIKKIEDFITRYEYLLYLIDGNGQLILQTEIGIRSSMLETQFLITKKRF